MADCRMVMSGLTRLSDSDASLFFLRQLASQVDDAAPSGALPTASLPCSTLNSTGWPAHP